MLLRVVLMAWLSVVTKAATILHNLTSGASGEYGADMLGEDMEIGDTYAERKERRYICGGSIWSGPDCPEHHSGTIEGDANKKTCAII